MLSKAETSIESLSRVLEHSHDCVKLISPDGRLLWMNTNGQCVMEIDDFRSIEGKEWSSLWPDEARVRIDDALAEAQKGGVARLEAPCPTRQGTPKWWEVSVTATKSAQGEHTGFISISRDISQMHADREALQILLAEMRHRLKNSFAMVCAMLRSFARGHSGNSEFADEMIARISALATAQTLFEGDQAETDLETLLTKLVSPFREVGGVDFNLNCPSGLDVFREQADAVSLVIGELTVNSTKHGAIGGGGRISLNVEVVDAAEGRQVALVWQERSRAPVTSTTRTGGQGLSIIERICRARGAVFSLDWQEYGLRARLLLPVDARL